MTLETLIVIVAVAIGLALILYVYVEFEKAEIKRLHTYERLANEFFGKTKSAIEKDPEIPSPLLDLIEEINDLINYKRSAFYLFLARAKKFHESCESEKESTQFERDIEWYSAENRAQALSLFAGIRAGHAAMTYTNWFWGTLARHFPDAVVRNRPKSCDIPQKSAVREVREAYRKMHRSHDFVGV